MTLVIPLLAALAVVAPPAPSPTLRFDGAAAMVTISARIVRSSAGVGEGRAPPLAHMVPRHATVTAADGRSVAALIYDFE